MNLGVRPPLRAMVGTQVRGAEMEWTCGGRPVRRWGGRKSVMADAAQADDLLKELPIFSFTRNAGERFWPGAHART